MSKTSIQPIPASFISKAEVTGRITNYLNDKYPALSLALGKDDTKSVWYSLPHLEQLMEELRYQNASGMRIYFGAYPAEHEDYAGQLCLIMLPTAADPVNKTHEDIVVEEQPDFEDRFAGYNPEEIEKMYKTFNFGSPCPPACRQQAFEFPY